MKEIKVLGTGCAKCKKLESLTREAAGEIELECQIEKVDDIQKIMAYGVMMTPALVIDGKVMVSGRVPSVDELKWMLIQ